jgi:hypothetical protein
MSKQNELNQNAEYQRRSVMSQDERNTIAKDAVAKDLYDHNQKHGVKSTYEECQRKMAKIAEQADRKKGK